MRILADRWGRLSHRTRLRWLIAASAVPLFAVVTAFGVAPATVTVEPVPAQRVIEEIRLPAMAPAHPQQTFVREERIQRGETLAALLGRLQIERQEVLHFLRTHADARALHQLVPGRAVRALTTADGDLVWLRYPIGPGRELRVERVDGVLRATQRDTEAELHLEMRSAEIRSSLFAATDAIDLPDSIAIQLARMFSSDIDFHRDLRRGDRFSVIYEAFYENGERVRVGRIVSAEFINRNRVLRGIWFSDGESVGAYYTPEGTALLKTFLRSPLEFSRITSGFSEARLHPVLNTIRAHRGIDYAAPVGTPVMSTAQGTVQFAGRQGGYGNVIIVEHANGVTTLYAHLHGFAAGIRPGTRVRQGEVIGFVGMTGLATGPHLHYEFRINGEHQDPLRVAQHQAVPIPADQRAAFDELARQMTHRLNTLRGTHLAGIE
jgi:murein DD-endopeptidase MepM/ murein hydrolase activator NlpD